ncbi:membrane protein [Labrys miyagiensis]|uniref:Membrane protein n=1 Tax=Labrys miyagiensis TaxID=346912 RepID=A0ABQ6CK72_9HYPH|nr:OmpA family protein [Labrys miyagiensis]GLS20671.1 membrane protein [Labrys miyagiensis]
MTPVLSRFAIAFFVLVSVSGAFATAASAQSTISGDQMLENLTKAADAAPRGLSGAIIQQAALQHMKDNPGIPQSWQPMGVRLDNLSQINVQIQFALNSAIIRPESYATIGAIADALHHPLLGGYKFVVTGNTDTTGNRADNMKLSQARADAVVGALVTTFQVDQARLEAVGLGEEALQDSKNPKNPINRRVQVINIGKYLPK